MKYILMLLTCILLIGNKLYAQPDLPNIATLSQGGINVLSWVNPYTSGIKSVTIERSVHNVDSFKVIGNIEELDKPTQFFTDPNPVVGDNYYRVKVLFSSNLEWISNEVVINIDSNAKANNYRGSVVNTAKIDSIVSQVVNIPEEKIEQKIIISRYVYTNSFNGNINIELPNPFEVDYKVYFYELNSDRIIVEIPRINDDIIVLDKRNFQKNGVYSFVVYKDDNEFDKGMVTIN